MAHSKFQHVLAKVIKYVYIEKKMIEKITYQGHQGSKYTEKI